MSVYLSVGRVFFYDVDNPHEHAVIVLFTATDIPIVILIYIVILMSFLLLF
jgi:hypothetical protein